jgi:hypothetical protein
LKATGFDLRTAVSARPPSTPLFHIAMVAAYRLNSFDGGLWQKTTAITTMLIELKF